MSDLFKNFDFYRRVPKDLTESRLHSSILSILAALFMSVLFLAELRQFMNPSYVTNVHIDSNNDVLLTINFNITVLDLPCEFATIDVVDVLGTRTENVTKNVVKWNVDQAGMKLRYYGRNPEQQELNHDTHHDMKQLAMNGLHAIPVGEDKFNDWLKLHPYTFVDFYAPWCIWCQRLEPVWEAFAERVQTERLPLSVIKVDCMANQKLCKDNKIIAFPTMRLFKDGVAEGPDYQQDRTVDALINHVHNKISIDEQLKGFSQEELESRKASMEANRDDHPGCMLTGWLTVNRVPGNFHIEARSINHNLNPKGANLSHVVNHLSFGQRLRPENVDILDRLVSKSYFDSASLSPLSDSIFVNLNQHQSFHHYMKVISTHIEHRSLLAYQTIAHSQIMQYSDDDIPQAVFSYDLSPIAISVSLKGTRWYEFVTSICAIIGGTFTVVGLVSSFLGVVFKPKST